MFYLWLIEWFYRNLHVKFKTNVIYWIEEHLKVPFTNSTNNTQVLQLYTINVFNSKKN